MCTPSTRDSLGQGVRLLESVHARLQTLNIYKAGRGWKQSNSDAFFVDINGHNLICLLNLKESHD